MADIHAQQSGLGKLQRFSDVSGGAGTEYAPAVTIIDASGNAAVAAAVALADGMPKPTTGLIGAVLIAYNGTTEDMLRVDAAKNLLVSLNTLLAGEDQTLNRLWGGFKGAYSNIASATTTIVKAGAGVLHSIVVNNTAAGAITVYDNTAASGSKIATLKASIAEGTYIYDVAFATGLTIVTAAASDITVNFL